MVEQGTHKPLVGGSNPPAATFFISALHSILSCWVTLVYVLSVIVSNVALFIAIANSIKRGQVIDMNILLE